jgi:hypothetical protein
MTRMCGGPTRKREDFRPIIQPEKRNPYSRWDGIDYYGLCEIDGRTCYFDWIDEVADEPGPWRKVRWDYKDVLYVTVERDLPGVRVYAAYGLTGLEKLGGLWKLSDPTRKRIKERPPIGYWFEDGLEDSVEILFEDPESEIVTLPLDQQEIIASLPWSYEED